MKVIDSDGKTIECAVEEEKSILCHAATFIMAQAIKRLYPNAKLAYGTANEKGFYYDIDIGNQKITDQDIVKLENEMRSIVKSNLPVKPFVLSREDALALMQQRGEPYKVECIQDQSVDVETKMGFFQQGEYVDMYDGPYIAYTKGVKAFKLTGISGAYWKNNRNNIMLTRIKGVAFSSQAELDQYLATQAEIEKRDHNKIGRELEFFTTVDYVGQGLPIMLPKGARVIQLLQRWVEDVEQSKGCMLTKTPLMAKRELYQISGHWDHYLDGMFIIGDPTDNEHECFALRPMTCPFQYQVFLNRKRSYRDLPMRLTETSTLFRNEDSGEMHGLIRVRQFTISEGHYILRPEQLEEEFKGCLELAKYFLDTIGLLDDCTFRFSQWDPTNPNNKYEGTAEQWETAQSVMKNILDDLEVNYTIGIDEAAFYGPKLDIQYHNVYGKEDTLVTIQIDMLLAKKFGMEYVDSDGLLKNPYIIHRTSLGCFERTLAYLLEKYAGALPMWMMPQQISIIPLTDNCNDYSFELKKKLSSVGLRAEVDARNETLGKRIREAQLEKIPYMLVVGNNEVANRSVSVRSRKGENLGTMTIDEAIARFVEEVETKNKGL